MARLDDREKFPSGMENYLAAYGWHFSKKMCEWASSRMYRREGERKVYITPYTKEHLDNLTAQYSMEIKGAKGYDAVYVANMCKADFFNSSIRGEVELVQYVKDVIEDPDAYEGMVFTRFYADCIGSGTPIQWDDMI